jgi:hypothetical protein
MFYLKFEVSDDVLAVLTELREALGASKMILVLKVIVTLKRRGGGGLGCDVNKHALKNHLAMKCLTPLAICVMTCREC